MSQRWGGLASLVIVATYVVGLVAMGAYLVPAGFTDAASDPAASLDFLLAHGTALYAWYCLLYLVWAGHLLASGMVALLGQQAVTEIAEREPERADSAWVTLSVVQDALGGGIELVGAIWLLIVSAAALRSRVLSRGLAVLGLEIGVAGLATPAAGRRDRDHRVRPRSHRMVRPCGAEADEKAVSGRGSVGPTPHPPLRGGAGRCIPGPPRRSPSRTRSRLT